MKCNTCSSDLAAVGVWYQNEDGTNDCQFCYRKARKAAGYHVPSLYEDYSDYDYPRDEQPTRRRTDSVICEWELM